MSLKETIDQDIKTAMKARDQAALRALRAIKAAILVIETSGGRTNPELSPEEEMQLLNRQAKQRRESIKEFEENNRADLAVGEKEELEVILRYLPQQLTEAEVKTLLQEIIAAEGATGAKDLGKVMKAATARLAGQADGSVISKLAKELLA